MLLCRPVSLGGDTEYLVVFTGSMQPAIPVGSVILVKPVDTNALKEGDIICFKKTHQEQSITHRIVEITYKGFITKGDTNEDPDPFMVERKDVIGRIVFTIPYLGYLSYFVKTPIGFTLLIVVPAIIVIARETRNIINQRKTTDKERKSTLSTQRAEQLPRATFSFILTVTLLSIVLVATTTSQFHDVEISRGNVISAGVWPDVSIYTD